MSCITQELEQEYSFSLWGENVFMASKCKLEDLEVNDVESLKEPLSTASIHGGISGLSPIKRGRRSNYFEGTVSDGKAKVRLVEFSHS